MITTPDYAINPEADVTLHRVGREAQPVLVIDDLLISPRTLVDQAVSHASFAEVSGGPNHYPGLRAPAPAAYAKTLLTALAPLVSAHFGTPTTRLVGARCALSLTTTPASDLSLAQRLPHYDAPDPGRVATVHFLCPAVQGGTAFYRHRGTGFEAITPDRTDGYAIALKQDLQRHGSPARRYQTESDPVFEQTAKFEAKFNRILVFKSNVLHSGRVVADRLTDDPATGRLTANLFAQFAA